MNLDNTMIQEISKTLEKYDLCENYPINLLRESADNTVFVIGENDKKILRVSKRIAAEDIAFEYEALRHLAQNGVPVAHWITTKTGDISTFVDDHPAVLFDFLKGQHIEIDKDHMPSQEQAYHAGTGLGLVSNAASTFTSNAPRKRDIFSELERAMSLKKTFVSDFDGGAEFIKQVQQAIEFGKKHNEVTGFIHNDYRPSNVFFGEDTQVTGIIDFDWSCVGPIIKDLALAIMEWSFPDGASEVDLKVFHSFLDGYNFVSNYPLRIDDRLYSWIRFSALSEAATYFCDLAEDHTESKRVIKSYMYRKFIFFSQF